MVAEGGGGTGRSRAGWQAQQRASRCEARTPAAQTCDGHLTCAFCLGRRGWIGCSRRVGSVPGLVVLGNAAVVGVNGRSAQLQRIGTHASAYAQTRTHTRKRIRTHTHTHTRARKHTHAQTRTHAHARTHTRRHTRRHTDRHRHARAQERTIARERARTRASVPQSRYTTRPMCLP